MLHLRLIFAVLLSIMATVSWAADLDGCRKPEIASVTEIKAKTAKFVRDVVTQQIAIAINDYGFGKKEMRQKDPEGTLRRVMGERYFQQYTRNLNVQVETYLVDSVRSSTAGDANDPCYMKVTITGIRDVSDTSGEFLFNMVRYKEGQPIVAQTLATTVSNFSEKLSSSISMNYAKIIASE